MSNGHHLGRRQSQGRGNLYFNSFIYTYKVLPEFICQLRNLVALLWLSSLKTSLDLILPQYKTGIVRIPISQDCGEE